MSAQALEVLFGLNNIRFTVVYIAITCPDVFLFVFFLFCFFFKRNAEALGFVLGRPVE